MVRTDDYRMSRENLIFINALILCCLFSTSIGVSYDRVDTRRSATNYAPQQLIHTSDNIELYQHRSPVCLIHQLAQKNNITLEYELLNYTPSTQMPIDGAATTPKPSSHAYRLHLGNEIYRASASTKSKAKDKVSREAYDKTKYIKPKLKDRTCAENATRTIVSILYEFAAVNGSHILDKQTQIGVNPPKFRVDLTLNQTTAFGEGYNKRVAKKEAAAKLVTIFGKDYVLHEITKKFNDDKYIALGPVERLNRILYTRAEPSAEYQLNDEVSDTGGITYLSHVGTDTGESIGSGRTLEASREDAANHLMKSYGFKT